MIGWHLLLLVSLVHQPPQYMANAFSTSLPITRWTSARTTTNNTPLYLQQRPLEGNNNKLATSSSGASSNKKQPLVRSRLPHQLSNGRGTFLGFRNTKDVPGMKTALQSSETMLMPDGGLSPCVIRVLGVGGGGCNAVRFIFSKVFGL